MNNRRSGSIAGNPILIGAATILVAVVAVFLAYNANEGLPFVPKYTLTAEFPNADSLVKGNEVKVGGSRVGMVTAIRPKTWPDGRVTALVDMQLDKKIEPVPDDSTVEIRPVSPLGLKFVDLHRGTSTSGFSSGTTMPITAATPIPVQIDDIFNMFDKPTRDASQANLIEFGNAIAGRGLSLNQTIRNLDPLLKNVTPVMKNLSSPGTGLSKLFPAFEQTARQTAPVAEEQASLFRGLNQTFTALAGVTDSIKATIAGAPPALEAAISSFPDQRQFLTASTTFFSTLTPGVTAVAGVSDTLESAAASGADPNGGLANSPQLNSRLQTLIQQLQVFLLDPRTQSGVLRALSTTQVGNPLISWVAPTQTKCNYVALVLRNAGSIASDGFVNGTSGGTLLRALPVFTASGPDPWSRWVTNALGGASGSIDPGTGKRYAAGPTGDGSISTNYLHSNSYPYTAAPGQSTPDGKPSCSAGNEYFPDDQGPATDQGTQLTAAEGFDSYRGTKTDTVQKPGEPRKPSNYPFPTTPPWK